MKVRSLRSKVTALFLLVVVVAVTATLIVTSHTVLQDKRDYVMDIAAIVAPNIADGIGKFFKNLDDKLLVFDDILKRSKNDKNQLVLLQSSFLKMNGVARLEIFDSNRSVVVLNTTSEKLTVSSEILKEIQKSLRQSRKLSQTTPSRVLLPDAYPDFAVYSTKIRNLLYTTFIRSAILQEYLQSAQGLNARLVASESSQHQELVRAKEITVNDRKLLSVQAPIVDLTGSLVHVDAPVEHISQMVQKLVKSQIPFLCIVLVVVIFMGVLFSRKIVMPIEALTSATKEIAQGHWSIDLKPKSSDEIGRLTLSFIRMGEELKSREKALEVAHEKLIEKERLAVLGQFGAGIAHEVKNPLHSILGYAQLLQRNLASVGTSDTIQKYLGFILDETRRASRIITDLLTFSKQRAPILTENNLASVLNLGCEMMSLNAENAKVKLVRKIPAEPLSVQLDKDQFFQVLINLSTNAIHAMEEKAAEQRVLTIALEKLNSKAVVLVQDTGSGILKENLPKIFEPFFTTKKGSKGIGLGLSMCHGIIVQHKGELQVESEVGKGTTFKIILPVSI